MEACVFWVMMLDSIVVGRCCLWADDNNTLLGLPEKRPVDVWGESGVCLGTPHD